jgi:hypothetical protein
MGEIRNAHKSQRVAGRLTRRWDDNINMDIKKWGFENVY